MATERVNDLAPDEMNGTPLIPRVVDGVKRADDKLVTFVQERPLVALGAALAIGYVIGRVLTR